MYLSRMPKFVYHSANSLEEACSLLSEHRGDTKVKAGGTDLLPMMKQRTLTPHYVIGLKKIPNIDYIHYAESQGLRIGAMATHQTVADSPLVKGDFDVLATACDKVGTPQIRNMGTIGGNLCNAGPSADSTPPLLVLDATVKLLSSRGERLVTLEDFFVAPFQTALFDDELLVEIQIPKPPSRSAARYKWITKRSAVDETLVGVAALLALAPTSMICTEVRIALCSIAPVPLRAKKAENLLKGKKITAKLIDEAAQTAASETSPRSRAEYRKSMSAVLVKRALNEALEKIK